MIKKKTLVKMPHAMPTDLRKALAFSPTTRATWDDATALARNEWTGGMRRPCCWDGCLHRTK